MKKEIIGIFVGVFIIFMVSFISTCFANYEDLSYHVYQKRYISYDIDDNYKFNKHIYKLNNHKLPTIIIERKK